MKMKFAILTDESYYSTDTIMEFIYGLKQRIKGEPIIIAGTGDGQNGKLIKKIALEAGYEYQEYTPFNKSHNMFTCLPRSLYTENYRTGGPYFIMEKMVDRTDSLIVFSKTGQYKGDKRLIFAVNRAIGKNRNLVVIK